MDPWREERVVIIETATLHAGTCTRSRVITYFLDLSSWIHGAMHVEERVVIIETAILHAGTCTSREITYPLDSSSCIHRAMHVEERVVIIETAIHSMQAHAHAQGVG